MSRVAYDRFVLEMPPAEPGWQPLADADVAHDVAGWLWEFGPTPLVAVVEHDGSVPQWLSDRITVTVPWKGKSAAAFMLQERAEFERFLQLGAPHQKTHVLWPRVSPAKTFEALSGGGEAWTGAVDAHARVIDGHVEVIQLQPV